MRAHGFTLLELMIVVAIIAIIAAIALPIYQQHVARSVAVAALAEIAPARIGYEARVNEGTTTFTLNDIGVATSTNRCDMSLDISGGTVTCLIKGNLLLGNTSTITMTRSSSGEWMCSSTIPEAYRPHGCL